MIARMTRTMSACVRTRQRRREQLRRKYGTSPVALGIDNDDRQVRPGSTKPESAQGLRTRLRNEAWVSGFHRGQWCLPRTRPDIELRCDTRSLIEVVLASIEGTARVTG